MVSSWRDLTELEQQLLRCLADDFTHTEIARQLPKKNDPNQRYSSHYIAHRLSDLYKKIGVYGKAGAVDWYHKNNQATAVVPRINEDKNNEGAEEAQSVMAAAIQTAVLPRSEQTSLIEPLGVDEPFTQPTANGQQLESSAQPISQTLSLLLSIWGIFSLLCLGILFYRASQSPLNTAIEFPVLDMNFIVPLLIGLYGLLHSQQAKSAVHPAIRNGYLLVSIGTLFWVVGEAIWFVNAWTGEQTITETTFGLADALAYIPHHLCLLAAAYLIWRQRASLLGPVKIKTISFSLYLCAWLLLNTVTIAGFYRWQAEALNLYQCYYALLDSSTLLFLAHVVHSHADSLKLETTRPILRSLRYLLAAAAMWWLSEIAFAISTSLQATNLLAYHNVGWADLIVYTALLLQGVALLLLPTSSQRATDHPSF